MSRIKFEYEEKHHIIEVDGKDYEIPPRTPKLENLIREHDKKIPDMTEYESNISLITILFGEKNVKKMFPSEDDINLDKLAKLTRMSIAAFMSEYNLILEEDIKKQTEKLKPVLKSIDSARKGIEKISKAVDTKKFVSKKR